MSKRSPKPLPAPVPTPASASFHSPFGALGSLRAELPKGPPSAIERSETADDGVPESARPAPGLGKLVLQREKKGRGGKTVTRVRGLPPDELPRWAGDLKRALGCGATVEGDDVVLLGDLVGRAADWLTARGAKQVVRGN